jgi:hypothetical protein
MGKEMSEPQPRQFTHPASANEFIEQQLHEGILKIERLFDADAISINGPILFGLDDSLRFLIEDKNSQDPQRDKLVVVLTTTGGYIEVVQRIVAIFRKHYKLVDFIIPNYAYSAGTVLAMSGDAIHMDYYSRLGPIDPQIETEHGRGVSALGYLERYNDLIKKAGKNEISTAEVQLMIHGFDQGELYAWEQARELSITLLKEWLVQPDLCATAGPRGGFGRESTIWMTPKHGVKQGIREVLSFAAQPQGGHPNGERQKRA